MKLSHFWLFMTNGVTLYVKSCRVESESLPQAGILTSAVKLMANGHVQELMEQLHGEMFSSVQQINVSKLTGKWHRQKVIDADSKTDRRLQVAGEMIKPFMSFKQPCQSYFKSVWRVRFIILFFQIFDSADVDAKDCNALYATVVHETNLTASVSVKEYYQAAGNNGSVRTTWSSMIKMGPDPAGFLFFRGRDEDVCPYFVVLVGPSDGHRYEYMILSHLFKAPVIVLCRDWLEFHYNYEDNVSDFLRQHRFFQISDLDNMKEKIPYRDLSECSMAFYNHL
ncbi:hypothetical protein M513_11357 [Trichuris suis]|uniref:Lipocalin domain-containing protein n=1 Tax=Trichuris suis TaxID=68888 RepID=A0A085LRZ9_9BILA|nr:hypothetical protein M513_11357 [Trichuris suis]